MFLFSNRLFLLTTILITGLTYTLYFFFLLQNHNFHLSFEKPKTLVRINTKTSSIQLYQNANSLTQNGFSDNIDPLDDTDDDPPNQPPPRPSRYQMSRKKTYQNILQTADTDETDSYQRICPGLSKSLWSRTPGFLNQATLPVCSIMLNSTNASSFYRRRQIMRMSRRWTPLNKHNQSSLFHLVSNSTNFRHSLSFPTKPASKEEAEYPLAYVFMANRNAAQTIRLFRMIYQPQNVYCIAYDTKGNRDYIQTILAMASCFPSNVFINPRPERIYYFGFSITRSVMNCMTVLHQSPVPWKYVQVVSWNDFPLRTNLEMVRIFKILNGSQDSALGLTDPRSHITRKWRAPKYGHKDFLKDINKKDKRRRLPPEGLTFYKGSFATSMTREFVEWMFTNPTSIKLYNYFYDSKGAEEWYWPTLIHNIQLKAPGGFPGQCQVFYSFFGEKKPYLSRFQVWKGDIFSKEAAKRVKEDKKITCKGKLKWFSCIYGVLDLPMLLTRMELIAHKLYAEYEPALLYCLEEWYWQKVCTGHGQLDWSFYENLPSVRYHNMPDDEKENFICKV